MTATFFILTIFFLKKNMLKYKKEKNIMINQNKLQLYLENNFNVLMSGRHGVGKTAVIKSVFEKAGLEWRYFSAATMDPWVDFIGVPKSVKDEQGNETLELIKPKDFALDKIEALFFDEFNRAHPKVMNAVMELIQFKSINGHKLNNLKVVWAAVNPWDEDNTYEVEQIDPAVKDRFHVYLDIPYKIDNKYFTDTYGIKAQAYIDWWNELPKKIQSEISPRRVEYAIKINTVGGALTDVLPSNSNIKKLKNNIQRLSKKEELLELVQSNPEEISEKMTLDNTKRWYNEIMKDSNLHTLIPYFHKEFIEQKIAEGNTQATQKISEALNKLNKKGQANKIEERIEEVEHNRKEQFKKDFTPYLDNFIKKTSSNAITKTFAKKLYHTYMEFCKNNTTDNYFDFLFKQSHPETVQKIYDSLTYRPYSGPNISYSTFFPAVKSGLSELKDTNNSISIFMGLLYQYAYIYQKNNSFYNNYPDEANQKNKKLNKTISSIKEFLLDYTTKKEQTTHFAQQNNKLFYFSYGFADSEAFSLGQQITNKNMNIKDLHKQISIDTILKKHNNLNQLINKFDQFKIETHTTLNSKPKNRKKPKI